MSSGFGSFVLALFCAARKISLSRAIASSRAAMLFSRPTNSCDTMCGNTMMSRSGSAGSGRRAAPPGLSLLSFLKNIYRGAASADAGLFVVDDQRRLAGVDGLVADDHLLDAALRGDLVHDVEHR